MQKLADIQRKLLCNPLKTFFIPRQNFDAFHTCLPYVTQCPSLVCIYRTAIRLSP